MRVKEGGKFQPAGLPKVPKKLSTLKEGLLRIGMALLSHEPMPKGKIEHHDWPKCTRTIDTLDEPYVHK